MSIVTNNKIACKYITLAILLFDLIKNKVGGIKYVFKLDKVDSFIRH